jgi:hypothetical protein
MLLEHCERRAASRAAWIAGNSKATKIPMMAITTNNSTKVNPVLDRLCIILDPLMRTELGYKICDKKRFYLKQRIVSFAVPPSARDGIS